MVNVIIKPQIIEWALQRVANEEKILGKFPVKKWISGEKNPTFKQLEAFASATYTPLGYFFLNEVPNLDLAIPHYRTLSDETLENQSPDLIETIHTMERRQEFMKEYMKENIGIELEFINSFSGNNPQTIAAKIYEILNLQENWASIEKNYDDALKLLISKCEEQYITVMVNGIVGTNTTRKLNVEEFRGFVLVDKVAPLIFINASDSKAAQIFTLIHEIAHLIIGSTAIVAASPLNDSDGDIEKLCNRAAVEFLCPESIFIPSWNEISEDKFEKLSNKFKVSKIVIARRALDLKLINKEEFFRFYTIYKEMLSNLNKEKSSGGNFYNTTRRRLGNLFTSAIDYKLKNKSIQYTDAYKLTGLKAHTFHNYIDRFNKLGGW
ncbi:ImmA/IrrE family metallo-endopeptidase [Solibacillus sp. FSL R5-0691]|uniref:ImmA/IrrE family metallo-endopeptidase n=1 Tax=Solibacillus sp. FSL R5-0691 TaxID=2921653 RepID=UPI0030CA7CDD